MFIALDFEKWNGILWPTDAGSRVQRLYSMTGWKAEGEKGGRRNKEEVTSARRHPDRMAKEWCSGQSRASLFAQR